MFNYEPYRKLLKEKNIKGYELIKDNTINARVASSLKNNKSVTVETLDKLCTRLNCQFSDLVEHIENKENE